MTVTTTPGVLVIGWVSMNEPSDCTTTPIIGITFRHNGSEMVADRGKQLLEYRKRTGPRGGTIKGDELERIPIRCGIVDRITDCGNHYQVYLLPPYNGWHSPINVSPHSAHVRRELR